MNQPILIVLSVALSYLLGSIPTAYLFGKAFKGIDIRQHGSGNVGATNAFRILGKIPGIIVLIIDILKGVCATALLPEISGLHQSLYYVVLAVAVVAGHNWTIFLRFKGGKGIATSLGVLIGLTIQIPVLQPVLLFTLGIWIILFLGTGFVSLASIVAATVLPFFLICFSASFELILLGIIFCVFVVFRHRPNINRLLSGKENRVQIFKKKSPAS